MTVPEHRRDEFESRLAKAASDGALSAEERDFFHKIAEVHGLTESFRAESAAERLGLDVADVEAMCEKLVSRMHFARYVYMDEGHLPPDQRTKLYGLYE
jgi:hypothetical protein